MQFDLVRDTTKLCRVCLMDSDGHRTDLYEVSDQFSLHEMLKAICATVFDKSDAEYPPGMPTTVCADCRNAVLAAFKLHQTCIDNERRLVELLALKWELQDLEIEEEFGDPLKSTNKELLSVEVENHAKTEGETHLLEEEQPKDEMEDSLSAGEHGNTIKVEELDLMDVDDNENGDIPETGEIVERSSGEDTNKTTCIICSKSFGNVVMLRKHMALEHQLHMCEFCIKPFACDVCPMRFITKVEIQGHMATHTKQQDHVCDLCGSRFTKKYSLKVHIKRVHEGVRPFSCSQCSLKFTTADRLQRHMYTHTGEKPYKCELCPQAYAQTNDLVKHVARSHGDGNPYLCDLCDEGFKLMTDLRQHYRVHVQSTEGGTEKMEEVRFTSVAILKRVFAKAKQRM
ncbi:hypothetical protein pipiens_015493 [Culex pipiens pipiens]|uniref:Uncharacterized protein n=3 Tax=Culex pipiens TaxID=7175 RepID=A0ABD1CQQ3_CULPP